MRTNATNFFSMKQVTEELDRLTFAASSLIEFIPNGSFARENAENAARGIRARIDYLIDSIEHHIRG